MVGLRNNEVQLLSLNIDWLHIHKLKWSTSNLYIKKIHMSNLPVFRCMSLTLSKYFDCKSNWMERKPVKICHPFHKSICYWWFDSGEITFSSVNPLFCYQNIIVCCNTSNSWTFWVISNGETIFDPDQTE